MQATINDLDTYYLDEGPRDAVPIILIHGFPFSSRMWDAQIQALKASHRVIAYDVRGHGSTEDGNGIYTVEFFVDDLFALMDHLKIPRAVLCGLSMGGYIALRAIEREPSRISGLILCDTRSEADTNEAKIKRSASIRAVLEDPSAFIRTFSTNALSEKTRRNFGDKVKLFESIAATNPVRGMCGTLLALAGRTDTTAALPTIQVPTLILVGADDTITPLAAAQAMQARITGSRLEVIPGTGHFSAFENPHAVNTLLVSFLNAVPERTKGRNAHAL